MARKLSAREIILLGGLGVTVVVILWLRDDQNLFGGAQEEARETANLGVAPKVNTDRLVADAEGYDPTGRNLFQYYTPPPPKRAAPPKRPPVKPQTTQRPKTVTRKPPPPKKQTARPPAVNFKYLGYLGPKDDKIAVFERGEEMAQARVGEVLMEQFRLVDFKYEAVVIGYVDKRFKDQSTELKMSR